MSYGDILKRNSFVTKKILLLFSNDTSHIKETAEIAQMVEWSPNNKKVPSLNPGWGVFFSLIEKNNFHNESWTRSEQ